MGSLGYNTRDFMTHQTHQGWFRTSDPGANENRLRCVSPPIEPDPMPALVRHGVLE
jgi:hypothetical protein